MPIEILSGSDVYIGSATPSSGGGAPAVIEELNVTPSTSAQKITAPGGVDGYSPVNVSAVTSSIDANIQASNIKSGVSILGVAGSVTELNGETVSITPSTSQQIIAPTSPANGITTATVSAVTSSIDANIVAGNIKKDVQILGVTGTLEGSPIKEWYDWKNQGYVSAGTYISADSYWGGVCFGNGKFIAVSSIPGPSSTSGAYSTNGYSWTPTTPSGETSGSSWYGICYGNGYFVKGGQGWMAYSTDGTNWTVVQNTDYHYNVCYGNGKFVATDMGAFSRLSYSTDNGATWSKSLSTGKGSRNWVGVCYGDGKFVAVAQGTNIAAVSTDAIHWTETTLPSSGYWMSVAYGNGRFVTLNGGTNKGAVSTDGVHWTEITLPTSGNWYSICYGGGYFVTAASNVRVIFASEDGSTWTAVGNGMEVSYVCFGDGKFVAIPRNPGSYGTPYVLPLSQYYTDVENPTTASTVYEEPFTASALTITSVGTGTITLSNSFTYNYNSAGNKDSVKRITTNGTYDVTEYESAVVNVPLGTKTITHNGTYTASTDSVGVLDGYSAVTVDVVGIPREIVSGTWQVPSTLTSFSLPSNVTEIGNYGFGYAFSGCTGLTSVDLSSLTSVSGYYGLAYAFRECAGLTSVDLSALTTISGDYGLAHAFNGCTGLISVDFSSLTTVTGASAIFGAFYGCTALTDVYFRALTTTSFGSNTNQFYNMLGVTGTTTVHKLHFPSNLQSTISGLTGYPTFGGTSGYVDCLFDLPATD